MKVYHSSPFTVDTPDVLHSRDCLDFGKGFYVTTLEDQARSYAKRFTLRKKDAFLNCYDFDTGAAGDLRVLRFTRYDEGWLDYVMGCRSGKRGGDWDIVAGGIANDKVFRTVDLYSSGDLSKAEALARLVYEKPNSQICFRTQQAIDACLAFIGAEAIE